VVARTSSSSSSSTAKGDAQAYFALCAAFMSTSFISRGEAPLRPS
jgi:hypothetical protein